MPTIHTLREELRQAACPAGISNQDWTHFKPWALATWEAHLKQQPWQYDLEVPCREAYVLLCDRAGSCIVTDPERLHFPDTAAIRSWADTVREEAQALQQQRLYGDALEQWQWYSRLQPQDAKSRVELARCLWKTGRVRAALQALTIVLEAEPTLAEAYVLRARMYGAIGWFKKALEELQLARVFSAEPWRVLRVQALLYAGQKQWREALSVLREALQWQPEDNTLLHLWVAGLYRTQQYDRVVEATGRWLQIVPEHPTALRYQRLAQASGHSWAVAA